MGFNRRKMEDQRRDAAGKEAASRRATDAQVLQDAERLIAAWTNARPNGCRCCSRQQSALPSQRAIGSCGCAARLAERSNAIDLRGLDRHPYAAVSSLIPALSCRSCRAERTATLSQPPQFDRNQ